MKPFKKFQKSTSGAMALLLGLSATAPAFAADNGVKGSDGPVAITKDGVERWIQSEDLKTAMRQYMDSIQKNQISSDPQYAHAKVMLTTRWQLIRDGIASPVSLGGAECSESKPGVDSQGGGSRKKKAPRAWTSCEAPGGKVCFDSDGLMEDFKAQSDLGVENMKIQVAAVFFHEIDHQLTTRERCSTYSDASETDANSLGSYVLFSAKSGQAWTMQWSEKPLGPVNEIDAYLGDKAVGDFLSAVGTGAITVAVGNQAWKLFQKYKTSKENLVKAKDRVTDLKAELEAYRQDRAGRTRGQIEQEIAELEAKIPQYEREKAQAGSEANSYAELAQKARTAIQHKLDTSNEETQSRSRNTGKTTTRVDSTTEVAEVEELGAGAAERSSTTRVEIAAEPGVRSASSMKKFGKGSSLSREDFTNAEELSKKAATASGRHGEAEANIKNAQAQIARLKGEIETGPRLEAKVTEAERAARDAKSGVKAQGAAAGLLGAVGLFGAIKTLHDANTWIDDVRKGALDGINGPTGLAKARDELKAQRAQQQLDREKANGTR